MFVKNPEISIYLTAYVDADVANDPDAFADADTYANDDADVTTSILIKMLSMMI